MVEIDKTAFEKYINNKVDAHLNEILDKLTLELRKIIPRKEQPLYSNIKLVINYIEYERYENELQVNFLLNDRDSESEMVGLISYLESNLTGKIMKEINLKDLK